MLQKDKEHTTAFEEFNAIKANDDTALKKLYKDNYYQTEKYVLNNNGSEDQAKDIYQEAFITVWRNIQLNKFIPEKDHSLSGYLYRIAKNKWLDHLRSVQHKKIISLDDDTEEKMAETFDEDNLEYIKEVKKNFHRLSDNCKELLRRFYYAKESLKIIAEQLEWTEATARNNKYRCLQKLRELIKK
jgi:RNA polymerase sigma factor (sigma-70 family)